jgi:hypothetical protein
MPKSPTCWITPIKALGKFNYLLSKDCVKYWNTQQLQRVKSTSPYWQQGTERFTLTCWTQSHFVTAIRSAGMFGCRPIEGSAQNFVRLDSNVVVCGDSLVTKRRASRLPGLSLSHSTTNGLSFLESSLPRPHENMSLSSQSKNRDGAFPLTRERTIFLLVP